MQAEIDLEESENSSIKLNCDMQGFSLEINTNYSALTIRLNDDHIENLLHEFAAAGWSSSIKNIEPLIEED